MIRDRIAWTVALSVAGALAGALPPTPVSAQDTFTWNGSVASGQTLEVRGINGEIRAVAVSGRQASVRAQKTARRSDPSSVEIEVVEHSGGILVCAVYPTPAGSREENDCTLSGDSNNVRDNDVVVDFEIEVPAGVAFVGKTINGAVSAESFETDVAAHTVNGDIEISTSAFAEAQTVNGSLDIRLDRADWSGTMSFQTVNGSITVALPADPDVEIRASSVMGSLNTDFPLTVRGRFANRQMSGVIGDGGRRLELQTVNGEITLRER